MKEKDFQTWWNNHYFATTHPAYRVCKSLYNAHADFLYIARLCYHFVEEDFSSKQDLEEEKKALNLFTFVVRYHRSAPAWVRKLISQNMEICRAYMDMAYQREVEARDEKKFGKGFRQKIQNSRDFKYAIKKAREVLHKNEQLSGFLWKYQSLSSGNREGRKEDQWGSFLLLAASEHLRETSGNPNYLLAARLLRLIRGQPFRSGQSERTAATTRVGRLKKSQSSWKSDLKQLRKFLQCYSKRDFKTFHHDPDYFENSFPHLEKKDLEKLKSQIDLIRPLIDLSLDS